MNLKQKSTFSELRVGIFVVIGCAILALAIFSIGTQVGLLQEQFWAKTYLNNVSGLKPGDIVLLGGVEVGNVDRVQLDETGRQPDTPLNRRTLARIEEIERELAVAAQRVGPLRERVEALRRELQEARDTYGPDAVQTLRLQEEFEDLRADSRRAERQFEDLERDLDRARSNLQTITILMKINSQYRDWIQADSNISLGSIGLLGDKFIEIALGRTGLPAQTDEMEVPAWFGTRTEEVVVVMGTIDPSFEQLITGANDILVNFETLSRKMQDIMDRFEDGEGTVGKFFTDPSFYNNLNDTVLSANQTVERAAQLMEEITRGPGTVPHLIQEREIYDTILATTGRLEKVMARIEAGEGSLGSFVNDPSLYRNADDVMVSVRGIADRIEKGEGTLGRLSQDEQLYRSLQESVDKLAVMLQDIEEGKGTLGMLAKDEALYRNINEVSSEMVKLLYDFRQDPKKFLTIRFTIF